MDRARGNNGFGVLPISHLEIEAWCRLYDERLMPWEIRALARMDDVRIKALHGAQPSVDETVSSRPMSPALFDAIFPG